MAPAFKYFPPANMIFLGFLLNALSTCFLAMILNFFTNHLNEPAPAEAINTYDMHATIYMHLNASSIFKIYLHFLPDDYNWNIPSAAVYNG